MSIEIKPTNRGFLRGEFRDDNGHKCSIQESSAGGNFCIWLGCDEIGLKKFDPNNGGWTDIELEQDRPYGIFHSANTRMHLTQEQVTELLPLLQCFSETGELPRESHNAAPTQHETALEAENGNETDS
jgi:hypothetical protein